MSVLVDAPTLEAAAAFVSTDRFRPQLHGIFVDGSGWVVATDGHCMIEVSPLPEMEKARDEYPLPDGGHGLHFNGEGIIIPAAEAVAAAKVAPKKHHQFVALNKRLLVISRAEKKGELYSTDLDSRRVNGFYPIEGPFPNWRQVIPTEGEKHVTTWSAAKVAGVFAALAKLARAHGEPHAIVKFHAPKSPLHASLFTMQLETGQHVRALLMPMVVKE